MRKKIFLVPFLCIFLLFFIIERSGAFTLTLSNGWNLVSSTVEIDVSNLFSDKTKFISIWKWFTDGDKKTWAVYLPGMDTQAYADAKGFSVLTTISPGEGFWINSKGSYSVEIQGEEVDDGKIILTEGWNLKGLRSGNTITVSEVFSDKSKFISVWKWVIEDSTSTWAVYLPGFEDGGAQYAQAKGFKLLTAIEPGEGFWVNAGTATELTVELPPIVGKVSEVLGKGDKNSYKPLAGATVYVDGKEVGKTDSLGKFETKEYGGESVEIKVELSGYITFDETVTLPESKQIYIFLQKEDTKSTTLEKTSLSKIAFGPQKPTPKVITSSDGSTSLQITNMKLEKDITVSVTPYKALNLIVGTKKLSELNLGKSLTILGGGFVNMVDSEGNPITNEQCGFSGQVTPSTNKILGKWTIEQVEKKLSDEEDIQLYLVSKQKDGWKKVGKAEVKKSTTGTTKYLSASDGVYMNRLEPFLFVMVSSEEAEVKDLITGKVVKSGTTEGIPGVYVGVDGFSAETITDKDGNFSLDIAIMDIKALNIPYIFLYTWKDGYYAEYKEIPITGIKSLKDITIGMKPFDEMISISGYVKDASDENPISDAKVILKTPSVLDEIHFEKDAIYVAKSPSSLYKWTIMEETESVENPLKVVKVIEAKGKNFLNRDDFKGLITADTEEKNFIIELEVTHISADKKLNFKESASGSIYYYKIGEEAEVYLDLVPDFTNFSYFEAWSDETGKYEFYGIDKGILPFLKISAKAWGYKPYPFEFLGQLQGNTITKDLLLQEQPEPKPYSETFETDTANKWNAVVLSEGKEITETTIGWHLLSEPEDIKLTSTILTNAVFSDVGWVDTEGTIGSITVDEELSDEFQTVGKSQVTFTQNGEEKSLNVILYDYDKDGLYDFIELENEEDKLDYDLWYDYSNVETEESWSMNLEEGDTIMVSYQGVSESEQITLLPAFSESHVFWVGNLSNSSKYNGTYYDPDLQTGNKIVNAILISPIIDLTDFSYPTLNLHTWFEVNAESYASMALEVAIFDDELEDGESVTIETEEGEITVKKGQFLPLFQFNPYAILNVGAFASEETNVAPLEKIGSLYQQEIVDEDSDGMDDSWEEQWTDCDPDGDLDPDEDLDQDGFSNLEEYQNGTDPCVADQPEGEGTEPDGEFEGEEVSQAIPLTSGGEFNPVQWTPFEFNLNPLGGHKIRLRFKFSFINNKGNLFRGWAIDDLSIINEESEIPFELKTPEFGYFSDLHFEELEEGESWAGTYTLSLSNISYYDTTGEEFEYEQDNQTIELTQDETYVTFEFTFKDEEVTLEGNFDDITYDYLNFWFYDKETYGEKISGWGSISLIDGEKSGQFEAEDSDGNIYSGDISLIKQ